MDNHNKTCRIGLLLILLGLWPGLPLRAEEPARILRLGLIAERSDRPEITIEDHRPLVDQLQAAVADPSLRIRLRVTADRSELIRQAQAGEVHLVLESMFTQLHLEQAGFRPRLVAWRKGRREIHSLFFVHRDSPIRDLQGLRGHTLVFESPRSTSAYALPRSFLHQQGIETASVDTPHQDAARVYYGFAGDERNQGYAVALGRYDAGAFNNDDWARLPQSVVGKLRVIGRTPRFLRWVLSSGPQVEDALWQRLETALLAMNQGAGREVLASANMARLEPFTADDLPAVEAARAIIEHLDGLGPVAAGTP